jgi:hypothetical protein
MSDYKKADFVNYTLTKSEQARIKKWSVEEFPQRDWLSVVIGQGYKVTLNYDKRNHAFACWLIALGETHENHDLILSGRGGTAINALIECLFKHVAVFKGSWPRPTDDGQSWTWDSD